MHPLCSFLSFEVPETVIDLTTGSGSKFHQKNITFWAPTNLITLHRYAE